MKKKLASLLLACVFALGAFAFTGCGGGGGSVEGVIRILMIENFTRMGQSQDTPVTKALQEKFDVEFQYVTGSTNDDVTALIGQLVNANNLPDLVISQTLDINRFPNSFVDLRDYKSKMPNAFKVLEEDDVYPYVVRDDGAILYVPAVSEIKAQAAYIIRTDWLDNLGLDKPQTIEDYEKVMYAFAQNDPDGNTLDDTYGFAAMASEWEPMFAMNFGASNTNILRDGEIVFGPTEDAYKAALQRMNKYYTDGILTPQCATNTLEDFQTLVASGKVGFVRAYFNRLEDCMDWSRSSDPNAQWAIILPPIAADGKRYDQMYSSRIGNFGIGISKTSKNKDVLVQLLDYLYSDEGVLLTSYGVEGETYEMVDGKPQFLPAVTENSKWTDSRSVKTYYGIEPATHFAMVQDKNSFIFRQEVMDGIALIEANEDMFENMPAVPPYTMNITYSAEGRKAALQDWDRIFDTSQAESFKFIMGQRSFNDWSKFQSELKSMGLDNVMKTINAEYQRVLANIKN